MEESGYIHSAHNVSDLICHFVTPTKYHRLAIAEHPEVKKMLWSGSLWSGGYFVSSVGKSGSESVIRQYVKNQGKEKEYNQLYLNFPT